MRFELTEFINSSDFKSDAINLSATFPILYFFIKNFNFADITLMVKYLFCNQKIMSSNLIISSYYQLDLVTPGNKQFNAKFLKAILHIPKNL